MEPRSIGSRVGPVRLEVLRVPSFDPFNFTISSERLNASYVQGRQNFPRSDATSEDYSPWWSPHAPHVSLHQFL